MANIKSDGKVWDGNLIIETGVTITAGSLIFADISGTNVVHRIGPFSGAGATTKIASTDGQLNLGSGVFLGVIANTQTGLPNFSGGSQTGVTWYTKGVFQFIAAAVTASCPYRVGYPVYPVTHDTVRCGFSAVTVVAATSNLTGSIPIGTVSYIPSLTGAAQITTGSTIDVVRVKISTNRTMQSFS